MPGPAARAGADTTRLLAVVAFVVGGLAAVALGQRRGWPWVRNLPFRLVHQAAIGVVAAQAWLGRVCPLTTLESWLRVQAGGPGYERGFIEHWVHAVLFHEAPPWVFTLACTAFALLVALAWWRCPPRRGAEGVAAPDSRELQAAMVTTGPARAGVLALEVAGQRAQGGV